MRSIAAVLEDTTGLVPRPGDLHVMIDEPLRVRSIQRVALEPRDDELVLSVWPGELKPQALWLYDAGRAQRLLAVARTDGWQIAATPHLAFRTSSARERLYLNPTLDPATYGPAFTCGRSGRTPTRNGWTRAATSPLPYVDR